MFLGLLYIPWTQLSYTILNNIPRILLSNPKPPTPPHPPPQVSKFWDIVLKGGSLGEQNNPYPSPLNARSLKG